ncbi:MAG: hypothetical protein NXI31_02370 [bacterium]|nr:hypothetical protein [bacterium]
MLALIQEAAAKQAEQAPELTTGGWTMMILSIGFVGTLVFCCYKKILTSPNDEPDLPGGLGP